MSPTHHELHPQHLAPGLPHRRGRLVEYAVDGILPEQSFLEMLDTLNETWPRRARSRWPLTATAARASAAPAGWSSTAWPTARKLGCTTCELRMRHFKDGATITVEPFRAAAFPILKDLVVDRSAFDRIIAQGRLRLGQHRLRPRRQRGAIVPKDAAEKAMDAAACIGCGACVAACPNASASLFTSAKVTQLAHLPQGASEAGAAR
jgi:succinate dehydrogenase / fumarate reductase iron-sulfur subunit